MLYYSRAGLAAGCSLSLPAKAASSYAESINSSPLGRAAASQPRALTVAEWSASGLAGIQPQHAHLDAVSSVAGQSSAAPGPLPTSPGFAPILRLLGVHNQQ